MQFRTNIVKIAAVLVFASAVQAVATPPSPESSCQLGTAFYKGLIMVDIVTLTPFATATLDWGTQRSGRSEGNLECFLNMKHRILTEKRCTSAQEGARGRERSLRSHHSGITRSVSQLNLHHGLVNNLRASWEQQTLSQPSTDVRFARGVPRPTNVGTPENSQTVVSYESLIDSIPYSSTLTLNKELIPVPLFPPQ
ncbi:hypothetical protein K438DRAFT_1768674 [Mycena galopus ATCC 62051]|nr:hypothetical protein K438DRAFT_1768674 [Mycena galopus ATCC 62051]